MDWINDERTYDEIVGGQHGDIPFFVIKLTTDDILIGEGTPDDAKRRIKDGGGLLCAPEGGDDEVHFFNPDHVVFVRDATIWTTGAGDTERMATTLYKRIARGSLDEAEKRGAIFR